jgi:hypothetical protein
VQARLAQMPAAQISVAGMKVGGVTVDRHTPGQRAFRKCALDTIIRSAYSDYP